MNTIKFIKENGKELISNFLQEDKKGKGYVCPCCNNGSGSDGTGIKFNKDGISLHCYKCGKHFYSILDIVAEIEETDFKDTVNLCCQQLGISNDYIQKYIPIINNNYDKIKKVQKNKNDIHLDVQQDVDLNTHQENKLIDYSYYYEECQFNLYQSQERSIAQNYLFNRGITLESAIPTEIGFDPNWVNPKAPNIKPSPRIILPKGTNSYSARSIDPNCDPKYKIVKVNTDNFFNFQSLTNDNNILFITEGEFDCLSMLECKVDAISIGGTSGVNKLIEYINENPDFKKHLIISLDNDIAGKKAQDELIRQLEVSYKNFSVANLSDEYKDINDLFQSNKDRLIENIKLSMVKSNESLRKKLKPDNSFDYADDCFDDDIEKNKIVKKTGFTELDKEING